MINIDCDNLKHLSYEQQIPFSVQINDNAEQLVCTEILRIIPGTRIVCKARMRDMDVIAKFFVDAIHSRRHIKRESLGLKLLREADIPTPVIIDELTIGKSVKILITEYLADAESPSALLKLHGMEHESRKVLKQFFSLLAKIHKAGLVQKDLHLDNFLLKGDILYAIDTASLKKNGSSLSSTAVIDNLALFFGQFNEALYPVLLQVLESYYQANPDIEIDTQKLIKLAKAKRNQIWKKVSGKLFRNCSSVIRVSNFKQLILCKRNYYKERFIEFLNNPDNFLKKSSLLKDGNSSKVGVVEIDGEKFAVKRFNIPNIAKFIRRQFPPVRTRRNWLLGHMLIFNNIRTPEPVAMIEKRFGPFRTAGYIVTKYLDMPSIRQALRNCENDPLEQEKIITCFVSFLKKLHHLKITHGDLKDTNFHYSDGEVYTVDLDSVKIHKSQLMLEKAIEKDHQRLIQNYQKNKTLPEIINRTFKHIEEAQ